MKKGKWFLAIILFGGLLLPMPCSALEAPVTTQSGEWLENLKEYGGYILGSFVLASLALLGRYLYRKAVQAEREPRDLGKTIQALRSSGELTSVPKRLPLPVSKELPSMSKPEEVSRFERKVLDDIEWRGNTYVLEHDKGIIRVMRNNQEFLKFSLPQGFDGLVSGQLFVYQGFPLYVLIIAKDVIYLGWGGNLMQQFKQVGKAGELTLQDLRDKLSSKEFSVPSTVQELIIQFLERRVSLKPWLEPIAENE